MQRKGLAQDFRVARKICANFVSLYLFKMKMQENKMKCSYGVAKNYEVRLGTLNDNLMVIKVKHSCEKYF